MKTLDERGMLAQLIDEQRQWVADQAGGEATGKPVAEVTENQAASDCFYSESSLPLVMPTSNDSEDVAS